MDEQLKGQPLERRVNVFGGAVFGLILVTLLSSVLVFGYFIRNFNHFFGTSYMQSDALSSLDELEDAIAAYVHYQDGEVREQILETLSGTMKKLEEFETGQSYMNENQLMLTRAVLRTADTYGESIHKLLAMPVENPLTQEFYVQYYETLEIGAYVDTYLSQLIQVTLQDGRAEYRRQLGNLWWMPMVFILLTGLALILIVRFRRWVVREIVQPVLALADAARTLVSRNMDIPDLEAPGDNEIGELTEHFNRMKDDCRSLIRTQAERARLTQSLFEENLRRMDAEKQLSATRFAMLRSQINPHFLFNTLNLIAQTAAMEHAGKTGGLIKRLSELLRYNLYNTRDQVTLRQELEVLRSYMYIQEARFGDRLLFWVECNVDEEQVRIPSFTLQPLVENAVTHGISLRQEGGLVRVKIGSRGGVVRISVTDNGVGIGQARLAQLRRPEQQTPQEGDGELPASGIGLANVKSRFELLYPEGVFRIYSRPGVGTSVVMRFAPEFCGGMEE